MVKRTPFVIQFTHATGETVQPVTLGVDSGFLHVGLSAVTAKQEVYAAEVELRSDMVKTERRAEAVPSGQKIPQDPVSEAEILEPAEGGGVAGSVDPAQAGLAREADRAGARAAAGLGGGG